MSSCRSIQSNASWAILTQRLLQATCIILYSMLRLITSDNDIASIMDAMPVSTEHRSLASCEHRQAVSLRNLFFYGAPTPLPLSPTMPNWRDPNAETPLPIKTRILYVNINLLTYVLFSLYDAHVRKSYAKVLWLALMSYA